MKNTFGVCLGLLAMGLSIVGAPMARAQNRMAANGPSGATETSATTARAPAASSPADLHQRIDALKAELADLDKELAAEKDGDPATSAAAQQDQGPTPATPAAAPAAAAAAPMPLPSPSMAGPLATAIPHEIAAGPFGKIEVTGVLSGMGWTEGAYVPPDSPTHFDISNAQVFIQKTTGWFQFYLQGGAYNLPAIGTTFLGTPDTVKQFYGPFPQGYVKLVKGNFNVEVGALPTLIGAEYTFSFENMNIERGLLWNQENAVNRGIQLNETYKKLTVAFSWNDGFYSNRYSWLSGSLTYAFNAANSLSFVGMGNAGAYVRVSATSAATPPLLNNSSIYNVLYTYTKGPVTITPYYQYTVVKTNPSIGIFQGAHTSGGAILANYNFKHGVSLAGRTEYIKSSGTVLDPNEINLLYGPGSGAFSFTITPTYVKDAFFIRGDLSIVHATKTTPAFAVFGPDGTKLNQPRGVLEVGFLF
jgi:putative OmpL-like beta-barrel porin-2